MKSFVSSISLLSFSRLVSSSEFEVCFWSGTKIEISSVDKFGGFGRPATSTLRKLRTVCSAPRLICCLSAFKVAYVPLRSFAADLEAISGNFRKEKLFRTDKVGVRLWHLYSRLYKQMFDPQGFICNHICLLVVFTDKTVKAPDVIHKSKVLPQFVTLYLCLRNGHRLP